MSASKKALANEVKLIASAFPHDHSICQYVSATENKIQFQFIFDGTHDVFCNILEPYLTTIPTWSTNSENNFLKKAMEDILTISFHTKFKVTAMLRYLVTLLCSNFNVDVPLGAFDLGRNLPPEDDADDSSEEETNQSISGDEPSEGISTAATAQTSSSPPMRKKENASASSLRASKRLMKELQTIQSSQNVQDGYYSVALVDDNLFEWIVDVYKVDTDSSLHSDMLEMQKFEGKRSIGLGITFKENFPFEPPFMRVLYPKIMGGYVLDGGAICLEVLTSDGWSSVYTIEALILQVMAAFAQGGARIMYGQTTESYNYPNALRQFARLTVIHDRGGWYSANDQS